MKSCRDARVDVKGRRIGLLMLGLLSAAQVAQADPACAVRLGQSTIDFGAASRGALLERPVGGDELSFGSRRVQVNVQCEQVAPLRLEFVAPVADAERYRFGAGTLQLRVVAVRVDGKPVQWGHEGHSGLIASDRLRPGEGLVPLHAGDRLSGQRMEVEFELEARIRSAATRVSDQTRLESHASFRLQ